MPRRTDISSILIIGAGPAPSPVGGEGWGEGVLSRRIIAKAVPPHPTLSPRGRGLFCAALAFLAVLALAGCATPRLYTEQQLSQVARACGAAVGEVVQEAEEPRLLFLYTIAPPAEQRRCVQRWANKRRLHLVYLDAVNFKAQ